MKSTCISRALDGLSVRYDLCMLFPAITVSGLFVFLLLFFPPSQEISKRNLIFHAIAPCITCNPYCFGPQQFKHHFFRLKDLETYSTSHEEHCQSMSDFPHFPFLNSPAEWLSDIAVFFAVTRFQVFVMIVTGLF